MPSKTPSHSTRLENLRLSDGRAALEIDGNAVELTGEQAAPAVQAFQSFYSEAQRAYAAGPAPTAPTAETRAPWWQRLRSWLARWLAPGEGGPSAPAAPASSLAPPILAAPTAAPTPQTSPKTPTAIAPAEPTKRGPKAAPTAKGTPNPDPEASAASPTSDSADPAKLPEEAAPAPAATLKARAKVPAAFGSADLSKRTAEPTPVSPAAPKADPKARAAPAPVSLSGAPDNPDTHPLLRSAFADEKGVHLIWDVPSANGPAKQTERLYAFNSPVADRLQDCYGKLSAMGYEVVDLQIWRKAPETEISPAPAPAPGAPPLVKTVARARGAGPAAAKAELPFVAKLGAPDPNDPSSLAVSELGGDKNPHSIRASDAMAKALFAAADPSRPESERLTYLRCARIGNTDRIMEVGFGHQADGRPEPAQYRPVNDWYDEVRKAPEIPQPQLTPKTADLQPELPMR